jgi:AraC-like DNA-binding protein
LIFDPELLRQTLPHADLELHLAMRQRARSALAGIGGGARSSLVEEVQKALLPLMPRCEATLKHVARDLNIPARTLQRKLAESGTGFQQLLDAVRREFSEIYLRDMSISILDVALLLGYAEQSSFTRAFRTWFGRSPSTWRIIAAEASRLRA